MLLRGGKLLKSPNFLQDSKFRLLFTVILYVFRMFVTFTYLFLFVVDSDLTSVCVDFSLDSVRIARYAIFANVLEHRCMDTIFY